MNFGVRTARVFELIQHLPYHILVFFPLPHWAQAYSLGHSVL